MKVYHYQRIPGAEHTPPKRIIYEVEGTPSVKDIFKEIGSWPGIKLILIQSK
jgi:hypothetical protein